MFRPIWEIDAAIQQAERELDGAKRAYREAVAVDWTADSRVDEMDAGLEELADVVKTCERVVRDLRAERRWATA